MIGIILLVVLVFIFIALLEIPALLKKKAWREMAAFSFFLVLGFALALPQVLGIEIPNPNKLIEDIFEPMSKLLNQNTFKVY